MAIPIFWQEGVKKYGPAAPFSALAVLCLFPLLAAAAAEATPRQREILIGLETHRPAWADKTGVWMLGAWDSDSGLERLIRLPDRPGNAAERFRRLEDLYPSEKAGLESGGERSRGVEALLEAAEMGECRFVPEYYPPYESSVSRQPEFVIVKAYFQALLRRAQMAGEAGNAAEAERCFRAALVCGRHLTADRFSNLVYVTGLIFKQQGAQAYARYLRSAGDAGKAAAAEEYANRMVDLMRAWSWKLDTALGESADFACIQAVIRVATDDKEVFWRKAAVEKLGVLRYGVLDLAGNTARRNLEWEKMADDALRGVASSDPDPSVRRLAIWVAMNLTFSGYAYMKHEFAP